MDVLTVGGKEYVKASVIARDLGYTADYVGQLCRARKVNAKLVGRSWYVDSSSIEAHKGSRYRSTQAQSVKQLRGELRESDENNEGQGIIETPSHFYAHNTRPTVKPVAYEPDEAELIPSVSKSLPVELADARPLSIKEKSSQYHFTTPKVPVVKFQGTLQVTDYESDEETGEKKENATHIHPHVSKSESKNRAQKIAISATKTTFKSKVQESPQSLQPAWTKSTVTQVETEHVEVELMESAAVNKWALLASVTVSTALVVLFFGLEANIFISEGIAQTSYTFGIENLNLAASVHQAADSFSSLIYLIRFSTNLFIF